MGRCLQARNPEAPARDRGCHAPRLFQGIRHSPLLWMVVFAPSRYSPFVPGAFLPFFVVELDERAVVMVIDGRNEPAGVCSRSGNGGGSFGRIVLACPPFAIFRWRLCPNGHQRDCRVSHEAQRFNSRLDREPAGHGRCKRRHTRLLRRPSQIPRCKSDIALLVGRRDRIQ